MCQYLSWIEINDTFYYLTKKELNSKRGLELKAYLSDKYYEDVIGHGAIDWYFDLGEKGKNWECFDFSSPSNFPKEIAEAIKNCEFSIGTGGGLLTSSAYAEFQKIVTVANEEYWKIVGAANTKFQTIVDAADTECDKIAYAAHEEYLNVDAGDKEYYKVVTAAKEKYYKVVTAADTRRWKIADAADTRRWKIVNAAKAERKEAINTANIKFWELFSVLENRTEAWR